MTHLSFFAEQMEESSAAKSIRLAFISITPVSQVERSDTPAMIPLGATAAVAMTR